jgi:hypothetical protein
LHRQLYAGITFGICGYQTGILAVMAATVSAIPLVLAMRWPPEAHRQAQTFEVSQTSKVLPREAHRQTQTFEAAETSKVLPREAHRQARTFEVSQTSKVLPRERKAWLVGLWEMWRSALGRRAFIAGFIYALVEGVLISTASLFLASRLGTGELLGGLGVRVATVAGLVLAVRWTSDILFGPAIGALSDRLGQPTALVLLATTLLAGIIGVTLLADAGLVLCLMVVFVSSSGLNITLGAIANSLALEAERPHLFIGAYTTAADAGSALGPLLAYSASALVTMNGLYVFGGGALLVASLLYWRAWRTRQLTGEGSLTPDTFFDSRRSSE